MKKQLLITAILFASSLLFVKGSNFHFEVGTHGAYGLANLKDGESYTEMESKTPSSILNRLSVYYDFNDQFSLGVGIMRAAYKYPNLDLFPLFVSVNYVPFKQYKPYYIYGDLGYSFYNGLDEAATYVDAGIGYKWMFNQVYGLKFELGYQLLSTSIHTIHSSVVENQLLMESQENDFQRHSLMLGLAFVF